MLKPERIKEIEDHAAWGIESGIRGIGEDQYEVIRMIEDLLIERNHVILPAFKAVAQELHDIIRGYSCSHDKIATADEIMSSAMQDQWKTFG